MPLIVLWVLRSGWGVSKKCVRRKNAQSGSCLPKIAYFLLSNLIFFVDNGKRFVHYSLFLLLWGPLRLVKCG